MSEAVEEIIWETIRKRFLSRKKRSMGAVHREIVRLCSRQGLPVIPRV